MPAQITLNDKSFSIYIHDSEIQPQIKRMAKEIVADMGDKNPLFICILNGSFMFTSELMREIDSDYQLCFAQYSSYSGTRSTGAIKEIMEPQISVEGRHVIILEDLIDSGLTLDHIRALYRSRGAKEVKLAVLLHKPDAPKVVDVKPDYLGLEIPPDFIVGHGLDYDGRGRLYKDIYKLIE
ncbi:MAG: phosphoribosyltransferase family protein [Porphyromonas sp.]|nr:phosphoribosyltransferase family protein [Porphyromonas sp.]